MPWLRTIAVVKTMTKALATPASERMRMKAAKLVVSAIASSRSAVAATLPTATLRSAPAAQP